MKTLIERPHNPNIKNLDRVIAELSKYLTDLEIDSCVDFLNTIRDSKYDINPSPDDSNMQMKLILGSERYEEVKEQWAKDNQPLLSKLGRKKYMRLVDGKIFDGLDKEDKPEDYTVVYR